MSEQNEKLTAEIVESLAWEHRNDNDPDSYGKLITLYTPVVERTLKQVEHATAELREQLKEAEEDAKHNADKWSEWDKMLCSERHTHKKETAALREELAELRKELEAVKKENKEWKARNLEFSYEVAVKSCVKLDKELSEAQRQRDEAVIHLREMIGHANSMVSKYRTKEFSEKVQKRVNEAYTFLSRLPSGETKSVNTSPEVYPGSWCYTLFKHMSDEHGKILTDSELQDIVDVVRKMDEETNPASSFCPHCTSYDVIPYGNILKWYCKNCGEQFEEFLTDKKHEVKHDWIGRTNYCSRCGEFQTKYNKDDICLTDKK